MKKILFLLGLLLLSMGCTNTPNEETQPLITGKSTKLPDPSLKGEFSLEEALAERRSIRDYAGTPLSMAELSQLLWAGQGITADWGGRTAPSAGGTYPLELYVVAGQVDGLTAGIYKYKPADNEIIEFRQNDLRSELAEAVLDQEWVREGAIDIIIAAVFERTTTRYGERGKNYVYMEAGHAAQNICLQATALNLGAVTVGAFEDDKLKSLISMPADETPLYVIPVGKID